MTYEFEIMIIWPPQFDIHKCDHWRVEDCGALVGAIQVGWIPEEIFNNNFFLDRDIAKMCEVNQPGGH